MKKIYDNTYKYTTIFNPDTGFYVRAFDVDFEPFMAEAPHLIDIGIMGSCISGREGFCRKAGIQCYQNAPNSCKPNMTFENYKRIIDEVPTLTQVALGGAGDPDTHENFEEILAYTREKGIVPNFTSSGILMTPEKAEICKKFTGAVAISSYSRLKSDMTESTSVTNNAINMLIEAGVKTSMHFVLGNNTIDEAIIRLKNNLFPQGLNAVIFLLHKNVGLGSDANVLRCNDSRVIEFFNIIDNNKFDFSVGFDSCSIAGILNFCKNINPMSIDTCEGGRYSMYISADMVAYPCSFDNQDKIYAYQMDKNHGVIDAWNSEQFERFRSHLRNSCPNCSKRNECMGGCPLRKNIVLCNDKNKSF